MFGYIAINASILKKDDYDRYRSLYCGLCYTLKHKHGEFSRLMLSYDMTFLLMILNSLYEPYETSWQSICIKKPIIKHGFTICDISVYVADMNILAAYYKLKDDVLDDNSLFAKLELKALKEKYIFIKNKYPRQAHAFEQSFSNLNSLETENCKNLDIVAKASVKMFEEIFVYKEDEWQDILRNIGSLLGSFIYFIDAYHDLEKDIKRKKFNALKYICDNKDFEEFCANTLKMLISDLANAIDLLPLYKDVDIIRNILYSGVWYKYDIKHKNLSRKDI